MTTPSIQADADTLIANARPSLQDISDAQGIVDATNDNSTDEERLATARTILETGNSNAQKELDDKDPANALNILNNARRDAQSVLDAIADEVGQEEALREVRGVAQDIRNKVQKLLETSWFQKNRTWVIVSSVTLALVLAFIVYKWLK
jgi:hypothetical protein